MLGRSLFNLSILVILGPSALQTYEEANQPYEDAAMVF